MPSLSSRTERAAPGLLGWFLLLLAVCAGIAATASRIAAQRPLPMDDCLRGQEMTLLREAAVDGRLTPQWGFVAGDEGGYARAARKLAGGEVATDFFGDFIEAARTHPVDETLLALSPEYRVGRALGAGAVPGRPAFVGFRSMVFAAWGVPVMRITGCTSQGLAQLRWSMLPWRAAGIAAAGLLACLLAPRARLLVLALASAGVALDAQLNEAGATFMPDMPGAALLLAALALLAQLCRGPSWRRGLLLGALTGLAALVKADLMYVLPAALLVAPWTAAGADRRRLLAALALALAVHALVLGAWAARNHALVGSWFVTSKDSFNLYLANTAEAVQRRYRYGASAREWAEVERAVQTEAAALREHGPEIALREHMKALARAEFRQHPLRIARMFLDRVQLYVEGDGVQHFPLLGRLGNALGMLVMGAALAVSLLALSGWRRLRPLLPAAVAFLASLAIVSLVFYETRYLSHLFALGCVLAVAGLASLGRAPTRRPAIVRMDAPAAQA